MRTPETHWPVVPRPFADEAFGGWLGRLAGRYRMTVDELAQIAQLRLNLDHGTWLSMPLPRRDDICRLAKLCRMEPAALFALSDAPAEDRNTGFGYCHTCLFLNPLDVTTPYWRALWLRGEALPCQKHGGSYDHVTGSVLKSARNLTQLLRFISRRRELSKPWNCSWSRATDRQTVQKGDASNVCVHR